MSTEVEIGRSKRALRAYSFDDIALVPARRTRDTSEVRVGWQTTPTTWICRSWPPPWTR